MVMNLCFICGVCMSIMYASPKSVCRKDLGYKGYESVTFAFFAAYVLLRGWNFQIYFPLLLCPAVDLSCVLRFSNMNYAAANTSMPRFGDMNPAVDLSCVLRFSNMNYYAAPPGMPRFGDMNPAVDLFCVPRFGNMNYYAAPPGMS